MTKKLCRFGHKAGKGRPVNTFRGSYHYGTNAGP